MEILERYLAAIRRDLPVAKADDIVAELRDDLLTRIEAREEILGRALDKADMEQLLRDYGRPMLVAARFREHQYLIGPATYPYYLAGLKFGAYIVGILTAVVLGVDMAFGSRTLAEAGLQAIATFFNFSVVGFGIVTFLFALMERRGGWKDEYDWSIEDMPTLDHLAKDTRRDAPLEIVAGSLFLLWWFGVIPFPPEEWRQFTIEQAPIWAELFWPIALLIGARLVMSMLALAPSRLEPLRRALDLATVIGGFVLVLLLFQAGHWVDVEVGAMTAAEADGLEGAVNLAIRIALVVNAVLLFLATLGGAWRWLRGRQPGAKG